MDYASPIFNELVFSLAAEELLGLELPPRAVWIRMLLCELNRLTSHFLFLATNGMDLGSSSMMIYGWREREETLRVLEMITGLRMNHAFIRPGGLAQDLPDDAVEKITAFVKIMEKRLPDYDKLLTGQPIWRNRMAGVGYLPVDACLALGITGPILRSAGLAWDLRKIEPYSGYENYQFDVPTSNAADCFARYLLRLEEMHQSLRIIKQVVKSLPIGPVMVEDAKIAWPAQTLQGS